MQLKTCLVYKFVFLLFNIRYSSLEQTNKLDCGDENCTGMTFTSNHHTPFYSYYRKNFNLCSIRFLYLL